MLQIYLYQYWTVAETQKKGRSAPRPCVDLIIKLYSLQVNQIFGVRKRVISQGFTLNEGPRAARFSPHYPSIPFTSLSLSFPLSIPLYPSLSLSLSPSLPPSLPLSLISPSLSIYFLLPSFLSLSFSLSSLYHSLWRI